MAGRSTSLFYKIGGYFVGSIKLDLILDESHSLESVVTEHQVENGSVISDHIKQMPRKGSLVGFVTNHPIQNHPVLPDDFLSKLNSIGKTDFVQGVVNTYGAAFGYRQGGGPTATDFAALERPLPRAQDTWDKFKEFMAQKTPVTIITGLEEYKDVVVTKVSTERNATTGDSLRFRVEFQEIQFVTLTDVALTTTTIPVNLTSDKNKQATPKANKGKTGGIYKQESPTVPLAFKAAVR